MARGPISAALMAGWSSTNGIRELDQRDPRLVGEMGELLDGTIVIFALTDPSHAVERRIRGDRAPRTALAARGWPGLPVSAELRQHLARFAVALRRPAQPMVRALEVAVLAQDDSEIALS